MLDNPNLTAEKMMEVMARGMDIVAISMIILIALLIYIYRYEIGLFLKLSFSNNKKNISPFGISGIMKTNISDLEKNDLNNKVDNLLQKFNNPVLDENDSELLENVDNLIDTSIIDHQTPIFRSLKIVKNSDEIIYHFVNDGGPIHNFKINSSDVSTIYIEPQNELESKGSGHFKFDFTTDIEVNEINFEFSYYDKTNKYHEKIYIFSLLDNRLT